MDVEKARALMQEIADHSCPTTNAHIKAKAAIRALDGECGEEVWTVVRFCDGDVVVAPGRTVAKCRHPFDASRIARLPALERLEQEAQLVVRRWDANLYTYPDPLRRALAALKQEG